MIVLCVLKVLRVGHHAHQNTVFWIRHEPSLSSDDGLLLARLKNLLVDFRDALLMADPPVWITLGIQLFNSSPLLLDPCVVFQIMPALAGLRSSFLNPVQF